MPRVLESTLLSISLAASIFNTYAVAPAPLLSLTGKKEERR